jgi:hypothetical protein
MNATPATIGTQAPTANPMSTTSGGTSRVEARPLPLPGSGAYMSGAGAAGATPAAAALAHAATGRVVALDDFGERGGPDVAVRTDGGMQAMHAVFQMDPATNEMRVSIVDAAGRLVRMIPPDSVAQMIAAMATYHGR